MPLFVEVSCILDTHLGFFRDSTLQITGQQTSHSRSADCATDTVRQQAGYGT